ncbi:MAG: hypothetical protein KF864_04470 [Phycisphaeraceae bacterium]|nr:hypothetical protein [Phycisphaeraceae bacterium]
MRRTSRSLVCAVVVLAPLALVGCSGGGQPRAWGPTRGESGWHAGASDGVLVTSNESRPKFVRVRPSMQQPVMGSHVATAGEAQ